MLDPTTKLDAPAHRFTLLTHHAHVLILLAQSPDVRMREIAVRIGITERAVQRIVDDLSTSGCVEVTKNGRRNRYQVRNDNPLLHPVEQHCNIGDLLRCMFPAPEAF